MQASHHNLLESCWLDGTVEGVNKYHYDQLKLDNDNTYRVDFTRQVTPAGVVVNTLDIQPTPSAEDVAPLNEVLDELTRDPRDGFECQTLGWTYLGNITTNPEIQTTIDQLVANGNEIRSILYNNGYFVFGCYATKQFYDKS